MKLGMSFTLVSRDLKSGAEAPAYLAQLTTSNLAPSPRPCVVVLPYPFLPPTLQFELASLGGTSLPPMLWSMSTR